MKRLALVLVCLVLLCATRSLQAQGTGTTGQTAVYTSGVNTIIGDNLPLDALQFAGADICADLNSAYAALPATGGWISVPYGSYVCTNAVVFNTASKPVGVDFNGAMIYYNGATNTTAITCDIGSTGDVPACILQDLNLLGDSGSNTVTGITMGDSSVESSYYSLLKNVTVGCFVTNVEDYAFGLNIQNSHIEGCVTLTSQVGLDIADDADDTKIIGGEIEGCAPDISIDNGNPVSGSGGLVLSNDGGTGVDSSSGGFFGDNIHFVNHSGAVASYINTSGATFISNSIFEDDNGTPGSGIVPITQSHGPIYISNSYIYSAGELYTEFIDFTGNTSGALTNLDVHYPLTSTFVLFSEYPGYPNTISSSAITLTQSYQNAPYPANYNNTLALTSAKTISSTTYHTFLTLPTIQPNTTVSVHCALIWEGSSTPYSTTFGMDQSTTSTMLAGLNTMSNGNVIADQYTTSIDSSGTASNSTAISGAVTPTTASTGYKDIIDFTLQTNGNPLQVLLTAKSSSASGTTTIEPGSYCTWMP